LPETRILRLERAVEAFDSGDDSEHLYHEFEALADKGVTIANYFIGCMLEDGSNYQKKDYLKAFSCYEKVTEEFLYLEAYIGMARILYYKYSGLKNDKRAREIYEYLLELELDHPVVCLKLGVMYLNGEGGPRDLDKAEKLFEKAVKAGNVFAMICLACLRTKQKRFFEAIRLRVKAGFTAFKIATKNRNDPRLRKM
jgi:TPR repeat protein